MRIGTWNVDYAYRDRLDMLRRVMTVNCADVWILTETHDDLMPEGAPLFVHSEPRSKIFYGIRDGIGWVSIWSEISDRRMRNGLLSLSGALRTSRYS